jgi:HPr kinase/phosphorylase
MTGQMSRPADQSFLQHASCVAMAGRAVLILGPSGSGKSTLALDLMALGAALVADDQVLLTRQSDQIVAASPIQIVNQIEARGVGILMAETCGASIVSLVVDLAQPETERLPPRREIVVLGCPIDLVFGAGHGHLAAVIVQYLKQGRTA